MEYVDSVLDDESADRYLYSALTYHRRNSVDKKANPASSDFVNYGIGVRSQFIDAMRLFIIELSKIVSNDILGDVDILLGDKPFWRFIYESKKLREKLAEEHSIRAIDQIILVFDSDWSESRSALGEVINTVVIIDIPNKGHDASMDNQSVKPSNTYVSHTASDDYGLRELLYFVANDQSLIDMYVDEDNKDFIMKLLSSYSYPFTQN